MKNMSSWNDLSLQNMGYANLIFLSQSPPSWAELLLLPTHQLQGQNIDWLPNISHLLTGSTVKTLIMFFSSPVNTHNVTADRYIFAVSMLKTIRTTWTCWTHRQLEVKIFSVVGFRREKITHRSWWWKFIGSKSSGFTFRNNHCRHHDVLSIKSGVQSNKSLTVWWTLFMADWVRTTSNTLQMIGWQAFTQYIP